MSEDHRQGDFFRKPVPRKIRIERGQRGEVSGAALDRLPDARDGLTREQRVILATLHQVQRERGDRNVPTVMLYGRVCEHISISEGRFQQLLSQLVGVWVPNR